MTVFLYTLGMFLVVVVAMAVGYIFQKKTIAGSCGGLGALGIEKACNCDNPCEKRKTRMEQQRLEKERLAESQRIAINNIE